jgi:hypothetical protein
VDWKQKQKIECKLQQGVKRTYNNACACSTLKLECHILITKCHCSQLLTKHVTFYNSKQKWWITSVCKNIDTKGDGHISPKTLVWILVLKL